MHRHNRVYEILKPLAVIIICSAVWIYMIRLNAFEQQCLDRWLDDSFPQVQGTCVSVEYSYNGNLDRSGAGWYLTLDTGACSYVAGGIDQEIFNDSIADSLVGKEISYRTMPFLWTRYNNRIVYLEVTPEYVLDIGTECKLELEERVKSFRLFNIVVIPFFSVVIIVSFFKIMENCGFFAWRRRKKKQKRKSLRQQEIEDQRKMQQQQQVEKSQREKKK